MEVKKPWYQRLWHWIKFYSYTILYILILTILTFYIICNWEKCISMQFFAQFDGNNILFLVWIASVLLFFYDVEFKGGKFHRRKMEETKKQFDNVELAYNQMQIENRMNELQRQEAEGGINQNGQSK